MADPYERSLQLIVSKLYLIAVIIIIIMYISYALINAHELSFQTDTLTI